MSYGAMGNDDPVVVIQRDESLVERPIVKRVEQ